MLLFLLFFFLSVCCRYDTGDICSQWWKEYSTRFLSSSSSTTFSVWRVGTKLLLLQYTAVALLSTVATAESPPCPSIDLSLVLTLTFTLFSNVLLRHPRCRIVGTSTSRQTVGVVRGGVPVIVDTTPLFVKVRRHGIVWRVDIISLHVLPQ